MRKQNLELADEVWEKVVHATVELARLKAVVEELGNVKLKLAASCVQSANS